MGRARARPRRPEPPVVRGRGRRGGARRVGPSATSPAPGHGAGPSGRVPAPRSPRGPPTRPTSPPTCALPRRRRPGAGTTRELDRRARADRPHPAGVDALLRRDLPCREAGARAGVAAAREACAVAGRPATPRRCPWPTTRWAWCSRSPTRRGARAVRRGREARRRRAQLLVARHRADGGRRDPGVHGDPARARPRSSTSSTTGTASATGLSSGSTCATSCGCSSDSAPTTTRAVLHRSFVAGASRRR